MCVQRGQTESEKEEKRGEKSLCFYHGFKRSVTAVQAVQKEMRKRHREVPSPPSPLVSDVQSLAGC